MSKILDLSPSMLPGYAVQALSEPFAQWWAQRPARLPLHGHVEGRRSRSLSRCVPNCEWEWAASYEEEKEGDPCQVPLNFDDFQIREGEREECIPSHQEDAGRQEMFLCKNCQRNVVFVPSAWAILSMWTGVPPQKESHPCIWFMQYVIGISIYHRFIFLYTTGFHVHWSWWTGLWEEGHHRKTHVLLENQSKIWHNLHGT